MGIDRDQNDRWRHQLLAVITVFAVLFISASPVTARQGEDPNTTVYPDDMGYPDDTSSYDNTSSDDPALTDTYADEYVESDPCDPAIYPGWADDPYCNPALLDDGVATYDPGPDGSTDYCDPEFYPDWASDPACNPELLTTTVPSAVGASLPSPARTAGRSTAVDSTPLSEVAPEDAPVVGAERMLLAIDAIAELGGFERAVTPEDATLLRDIQQGIPAAGLDEDGYANELEAFVLDFIPFLESLEASGVPVSGDLWVAVSDLENVVFDSTEDETDDDPGLLEPESWLYGLGDLLVRGGVQADRFNPDADADAIRELIAAFAVVEEESVVSSTTEQTTSSTAPERLAFADDPTEPAADGSLPIVPIAAGVGVLLLGGGAFAARRRSAGNSNQEPTVVRSDRPADGATAPAQTSQDAKASVSDLLDASRRMSASLDVATIAAIALAEAKQIVGAEGGIVVRRTDDGLDPVGCEPPMLFNYDNVSNGCLPRVIETGRATAAIAHDEPLLVEVPMAMGAVPIVADGVITGAILVVRVSAKPFDREELDALEMLAPLVGSAFAAADTHETATELVDVEPLTGLQNRRRLDLDLASISTDEAVAYVMIDIDHFKNFNDTNGHAAGDEALRQVSALLQASVRPKDLVYRYGGEEFCVLLPGATAEEAAVVAERARAAVETAEIPGMENQPAGRVTISVGISDSAFGTPSDLVERADAALYESKRNGRNQVTLSSPD